MCSELELLRKRSLQSSLPYDGDFFIDDNILALFGPGAKIISASHCGKSAWTVTARLVLAFSDGSRGQYFVKSAPGNHGRSMMEGECSAMSELRKSAPDFAPAPLGWDKYKLEEPEAYFFVAEYVDMQDGMPHPDKLCSRLARLHRESQSPTGQFGFGISKCQGRVLQCVEWETNWTTFFVKLLRNVIVQDFEVNGSWEDLDIVERRFIERVVLRLLDALVENGRVLKPSLIHADLWEGNCGTSRDNGNIYIFDAACFYGHHEMDVADWRCNYNKISDPIYTNTYNRYQEPSEPKDEWEDRNRLYSVYYNLLYSVNHANAGTAVRQQAYADMYHLVDKYAPFPGNEGPPRIAADQMAVLPVEKDHAMSTVPDILGTP
ncbi:Fructosamine kinase-domain-containing protein [Neurospora tetraspora]|uniref:protein-ribulosamine 3-kinase n=1 Tax=Neurospora tetraspora TaxID=94610 RepID=A0AAE0JPV2_9PEZI|nr:Fructosamine kinase-domain-containing protein [Neurospora tetraspora]